MNFSDYQEKSSRTAVDHYGSPTMNLVNWALGLAGESGELVDLIKKQIFHDKAMSKADFESEAGDVLWYLTQLCISRGVSLERVAANNIAKLEKRYPDGFVTGGGVR